MVQEYIPCDKFTAIESFCSGIVFHEYKNIPPANGVPPLGVTTAFALLEFGQVSEILLVIEDVSCCGSEIKVGGVTTEHSPSDIVQKYIPCVKFSAVAVV